MQDSNFSDDKVFYIERYKHILQEIHFLNENVHRCLTLFQALATTIATAGTALFVGRQQLNISVEVAKTAIEGLLGLLLLLAAFVVFSILAGIFSWLDYRTEEVELLNKVIGPGYRKLPKKKNFWRWQETYAVLFVLVIVFLIVFYVKGTIIPLIG